MKMKRFIYSAIAVLLVFAACTKEEMGPVISENPTPPALITPTAGSSVEITADTFTSVINFEWSAADFGFDAAINYTVQADVGDQGFAEPVEIVKTFNTTGAITLDELNNKLLAAGAVAGAMNDLKFRVTAKVSDYVNELVSAEISFGVQPFYVEVTYPHLNIPGNYQGWAPDNMLTVIHSLKSDEVYDGYVYFGEAATMFKFAKGSWDVNWGDDGVDGTLDAGGADIAAEGPAMYRLHADLNEMTYTATAMNWGLIGSATPGAWDSDQDMIWDADNNILTITLDLVEGEVKFRANDAWDVDFGDDQANGILEYGGANIAVAAAGNYTITLDLYNALYTYSITKN